MRFRRIDYPDGSWQVWARPREGLGGWVGGDPDPSGRGDAHTPAPRPDDGVYSENWPWVGEAHRDLGAAEAVAIIMAATVLIIGLIAVLT